MWGACGVQGGPPGPCLLLAWLGPRGRACRLVGGDVLVQGQGWEHQNRTWALCGARWPKGLLEVVFSAAGGMQRSLQLTRSLVLPVSVQQLP